MPAHAFDYATIRVVPRVDLGERINVGVIVFCPTLAFLGCKLALDPNRLRALAPDADTDAIARHLDAFCRVCEADPSAGAMARLPSNERFHWLVSPRSTIIQTSPVHAGVCDDPRAELDRLLARLVP